MLLERWNTYSYFEKGCQKKCARDNPEDYMGYVQYTVAVEPTFVAFRWHWQTYVHGLSCHSFKFLWKRVNSKSPTIPFGVVACTLSDNLSRNSCIFLPFVHTIFTFQISFFCNGLKGFCFHILSTFTFSFVSSSFYYSITVYAILHFKL